MIDAHVHLWDRSVTRYPRLDALPEGHRLRKPATAEKLLAALQPPPEGLVLIESNPADDLAEARWLCQAAEAFPFPVALVAHVPMTAADAPEHVAAQAALPGVVAIRDVVLWHPDPARRRTDDADRLASAAFRLAARTAMRLGLGLELLISSFQVQEAERLARDFPDLRLVLNHCGAPMNHGPEGRALWRDALERLAERPNITIKLSDPMAFRPDAPRDWVLDVLAVCLDIFGPARAAYGSNWPFASMSPGRWAGLVAEAIADLDPPAQARVWAGTARDLYFEGQRAPLPGHPPAGEG